MRGPIGERRGGMVVQNRRGRARQRGFSSKTYKVFLEEAGGDFSGLKSDICVG